MFYFIPSLLHDKLWEEEKHRIALRVLLPEAFATSSDFPFIPSPFRERTVFPFNFFPRWKILLFIAFFGGHLQGQRCRD